MTPEQRIRLLEEENEYLRARVSDLERALGDDTFICPLEWGLTQTEGRMLSALASRPELSKSSLMQIAYGSRFEDWPDAKIVDVLICKIRRKLKPFGAEIKTLWGRGYALDAGTREVIKARTANLRPKTGAAA